MAATWHPVTVEESSRAGADEFLLKTELVSRVRDIAKGL